MTKDEYRKYLQSSHWLALRRQKLMLWGVCQNCNFPHELDVHHRTYENLGHENLCDLVVLCRSCHSRGHFAQDLEKSERLQKLLGVDVKEILHKNCDQQDKARFMNSMRAQELSERKREQDD